GHVIRVAPNAFVDQFEAARHDLVTSAASAETMRATLDQLGLGRARIASKGLVRDGDRLVPVGAGPQERDGMFMRGSLATLRQSVVPMAARHESLCQGSVDLITAAVGRTAPAADGRRRGAGARPARVAIVGMSCLLPGAQRLEQYWHNLIT